MVFFTGISQGAALACRADSSGGQAESGKSFEDRKAGGDAKKEESKNWRRCQDKIRASSGTVLETFRHERSMDRAWSGSRKMQRASIEERRCRLLSKGSPLILLILSVVPT